VTDFIAPGREQAKQKDVFRAHGAFIMPAVFDRRHPAVRSSQYACRDSNTLRPEMLTLSVGQPICAIITSQR